MIGAENLGWNILPVNAPPLSAGGVTLSGRAILAPMAGVTDPSMRSLAQRYGASATISEMITASGIARGDRETTQRLSSAKAGPRVIQIAARDPTEIAYAANAAQDAGADWVDINMGCPCKRVTGGLAGAALMRDVDQAARLIAAAARVLRVPLSVKMRLGWDDSARNAPDLARRAQNEGATLITVHGRTRQQFYSGAADWAAIAAVKQAISVPLIANGDCATMDDAETMLRLSGADGIMIGRAAQGQPWLVGDVAHYLATGQRRRTPSLAERGEIAREHLDGLLALMGPTAGLRYARKHLASYVDHALGPMAPAAARRALVTTDCARQATRLIGEIFMGDVTSKFEKEPA